MMMMMIVLMLLLLLMWQSLLNRCMYRPSSQWVWWGLEIDLSQSNRPDQVEKSVG